jgi:alanine transaminase
LEVVREEVAKFIARRDGRPNDKTYSDPANIFLSDGASPSVQRCLQLLIRPNSGDAIMIPIPQYPLYSATITLLGGSQVDYYLDESRGWGMTPAELQRSYDAARAAGKNPRAVAIINPGNPTGQCLSKDDIRGIIEFAHSRGLVVMADEVYQENVYIKDRRPFVSFKSVKHDMGPKYADLELMSFHSVSKGFVGECGKRAGYVEFDGIAEEVKEQYYKLASINLCPNVLGQVLLSLMVRPPAQGEPSFELYIKQRDAIYNALMRRAQLVTSTMNTMEGVTCNEAEGAMYAFPQITLPPKAIETAKARNIAPDLLYCLELLDSTGICVVPGSGFGQREGTFHFRTTFLPQEEQLKSVLGNFKKFHSDFMNRYK